MSEKQRADRREKVFDTLFTRGKRGHKAFFDGEGEEKELPLLH